MFLIEILLIPPANLERAFTILLDLEILLRIYACQPRASFLEESLNLVDLFLAIVSTVIIMPYISSSEIASWLSFFAIIRWYRVVLYIPLVKDLLVTCFSNSRGIANMILLVLIATGCTSLFVSLAKYLSKRNLTDKAHNQASQLLRGDGDPDELINWENTWNSYMGIYQVSARIIPRERARHILI